MLVVILLIAGGTSYAIKYFNKPKACTSEAMICPDGSAVGRIGPNCEFAPCLEVSAAPEIDETVKWKTYVNSMPYPFQIKYPPDWIKKTEVSSGWPYFESTDGGTLTFNAVAKGGISGNDTIANYCQTRDKAGTFLKKHDIIIDNNSSVYCVDENKSIVEFMIPRKNTQYEIVCTLGKLDVCLQILSTFRFLD